MQEDVKQTKYIHKLVSQGVIQILRKPEYLEGEGALQIEMAGACWVLPEFYGKEDVKLVGTFKVQLLKLLVSCDAAQADACDAVLRDLWSLGGACSTLSLKTAQRDSKKAAEEGGFLLECITELAERSAKGCGLYGVQ
eukprot:2260770-Prymnesium_polylepis.1